MPMRRPSVVSYETEQSVESESQNAGILRQQKENAGGLAESSYWSNKHAKEITSVKYIKEIGLIATTFLGDIKVFDSYNFQQLWHNDNKHRKR